MTTARAPPELLLLLLLAANAVTNAAANFTCSAQATCVAMAGYVPANRTTVAAVASLFTLPSNLSLVAANNLPASTQPSHPFPANSTVRVPFPCNCSGAGTGVSSGRPIYRVREGDGLDFVARVLFNGMVTYQEIAATNGIPDPNLIRVGQELRIPLPCSCDEVAGVPTVHYAHMVSPRSSVEGIATEFGTTAETLLQLNLSLGGEPRNLLANSFLDVPLRG